MFKLSEAAAGVQTFTVQCQREGTFCVWVLWTKKKKNVDNGQARHEKKSDLFSGLASIYDSSLITEKNSLICLSANKK